MFVDRRPLFFKLNSICQFKDVFPKMDCTNETVKATSLSCTICCNFLD